MIVAASVRTTRAGQEELAPATGRLAASVDSAPVVPRPPIQLRSGLIVNAEPARAIGATESHPDGRYLIQLDGPLDETTKKSLAAAGLVLGEYIPEHAYLVTTPDGDATRLSGIPKLVWASPFRDEWKVDPELGRRPLTSPDRIALAQQGTVQVLISLFAGSQVDRELAALTNAGATVLSWSSGSRQWMVDATIPLADVGRLASLGAVQFIEEAPELIMRNNTNEWILQSNLSGQRPVWDAGIHGEGQVGGLIDGTIRESHCAFDDTVAVGPFHRKIVAMRNAGSTDSHGTHTAGTMAGDSGTWGSPDAFDGLAYAAKISFSNVSPIYSSPSTLFARLQDAHNDGARVHSNSWGDDGTTAYTTWCRQIDDFSYANEESLVAFAVTNLSALKTPENAKNVVGVAASRDTPNQHQHCSGGTGPTADGRRKPEIYAPGCSTQSANSGTTCSVAPATGTSMACPAVSGAGLLVRQYFTDGYYPTGVAENPAVIPSGALIKAVLLNSAEDMTGISGYPSNLEGWGRLTLDRNLYFPGDASRLLVRDVRNAEGLSTGQSTTEFITVVTNGAPLSLTLVFTEPPASVNASNPVINNLDLEVQTPGGDLYRGNVFSGGVSVTGGASDAKNNVERVWLPTPSVGTYMVTVQGTAVNQGTQGFALVVSGDITSDCNSNGLPDDQDISGGGSLDCNTNGVPDECEPDCNGDDVPDECELANCLPLDPACQDCNSTGLPDECDIASGVSVDCNSNGAPDDCDIAQGGSPDINGDGIPDECCAATSAPLNAPGAVPQSRYLSFVPAPAGSLTAIRVTVVGSSHSPLVTGYFWWVGPPVPGGQGITHVQCTPEWRDWSLDAPVIHLADAPVIPGTTYRVQFLGENCPISLETSYSAGLDLATPLNWGDVTGGYQGGVWTGPDGMTNFVDINATVQRFQALPTAPPLPMTDLAEEVPDQLANFRDIMEVVHGFQGLGYPFGIPSNGCP